MNIFNEKWIKDYQMKKMKTERKIDIAETHQMSVHKILIEVISKKMIKSKDFQTNNFKKK